MSVANLLDHVVRCLLDSASIVLKAATSPKTPRRARAGRDFQHWRSLHLSDRDNPYYRARFNEARREKRKAYDAHRETKIGLFFESLENQPILDRVRLTYRYLRQHRRGQTSGVSRYISIQAWESQLRSSSSATEIPLLPEYSPLPPDSGPTYADINRISLLLQNNTASGVDGIQPELLRYGSELLIDHIHVLLNKIWRSNLVPERLVLTLQVPIAKVPNPKGPEEYRRITLCSALYKIYSRFLLEQLESYLGDVPNYQFAYHRNRSAEDQIFIVRQLLDERWRKGRLTYVVSLDLQRAFDTIDLYQVPRVLLHLGVPSYLVNRIVRACLTERTSLQWFGQRTGEFNKTKGIKQGCPLSPKLFVYLLHQALLRLQQLMPELHLGQTDRIRLPCLRVYADDILAILTDSSQIPRLISLLETCLNEFGLSLNVSKSEVLVRDPSFCDVQASPSQLHFGNISLRVVTKMKYLGAYLTSSLNRRETVSSRITRALRVYRSVAAFARKYHLRWKTISRIYHTVITPIVLFGLKVSTLTKQNRDRLRDMEYKIVSGLFLLSRPEDDDDAASPDRSAERVDAVNPRR